MMPGAPFATSLLETEVVVTHIGDGHVFHFPILANGTVSLHGARIEPNPGAKSEARRSLFEACDAARMAVARTRSGQADNTTAGAPLRLVGWIKGGA
jgi:hypothetical protein